MRNGLWFHRIGRAAAVAAAFAGLLGGQAARGQNPGGGCTEHKGTYTCDWQGFRSRLTAARTVAVQAQPVDPQSVAQLRHLVDGLGKIAVAPGETADLTLVLLPPGSAGVAIGPADEALATLEVFGPGGTRGTLLWAETIYGQADRPWPLVVTALVNQFQERVKKHPR